MEASDIAIHPAKHLVILSSGTTYTYGSTHSSLNRHAFRHAHVLRVQPTNTALWPGRMCLKWLYLKTMLHSHSNQAVMHQSVNYASDSGQQKIIDSIAGKISIANLTNTVRILRRNEHVCQIREVFVPNVLPTGPDRTGPDNVRSRAVDAGSAGHSISVQINPDGMLSDGMLLRDLRFTPLCKNTTMCSTRTTAGTMETLVPSRPSSTWGL